MKYRLKDQELQKRFDAISDGDFSCAVKNARWHRMADEKIVVSFHVYGKKVSAEFKLSDLECGASREYDPDTWNEWPDIQPPLKTNMRIEILTAEREVRWRGFGTYSGYGQWKSDVEPNRDETVRFCPWENKE